MIKLLIKHTIGEIAVNAFFKQITSNFSIPTPNQFYVGQVLDCIAFSYEVNIKNHIRMVLYYQVTVIEVNTLKILVKSDYAESKVINTDTSEYILNANREYENVTAYIALNDIDRVYSYD